MPFSNFDSGFSNGVTIRGIPVLQAHPGKVFWVGNASAASLRGQRGAADSGPGAFGAVYSTLAYAVSQCVAGRGDIIFVKPGHAENIGAAAALSMSIAGVAVIGLGTGAARPTFSWTAAAATITGSAANVSWANCRFVNNFADVVTMFSLTGGADGWHFENCHFTDTSTVLNAIDFITLATGADDLSFKRCRVTGKSASNDSFLTGVAHDGLFMDECHIQFDVAQTAVVGVIETSGNATNVGIKNSFFRSNVDGALFLDFNGAANSGEISYCRFSSIDTADAVTAGIDFTGGHVFECYVAGDADSFGLVGGGTVYGNT